MHGDNYSNFIIFGTVSSKITPTILSKFNRTSKRNVTLALKCMANYINSVPYNSMIDSPILDASVHLIETLWSSRRILKFENLKNYPEG